jgi:hypothetical protein
MESSQQQNLVRAEPAVTAPLDPSRPTQTALAPGVTREDTAAPLPSRGLSFGDGFQFGCGFFLAGLIAMILMMLLLLLSLLLLSLTGVSLFGNLLGTAPAPL